MSELISIALAGKLGTFDLNVDFSVPMHGITALFGPSGCGKTSILKSVAGLNRIPGHIRVGDDIWQDDSLFLPTHKRPIGYVFQEASLFSHLSVRQNLTYGARRTKSADHSIRFDDVVELLGLGRLIDRSPIHLSGGERQRVSIGRALLSQPHLLLMDEPLSALDRMAKDEILPYFEALHSNLRIPILLVTHDIAEVERLADHLVLLRDGKLMAVGALNEVLSAPDSPLAARSDFAAILPGSVKRIDPDGIAVLNVANTEIYVLADHLKANDTVRVRIAASDVSIVRQRARDSSILNAVPVRIVQIDHIGTSETGLLLDIGNKEEQFRARLSKRSATNLNLKEGDEVIAQIKSVSLVANR